MVPTKGWRSFFWLVDHDGLHALGAGDAIVILRASSAKVGRIGRRSLGNDGCIPSLFLLGGSRSKSPLA
jgi:hypothetical protein